MSDSQLIPGVVEATVSTPRILIQDAPFVAGSDAVVQNDVTDTGSTPNTRIRPGQVLVLRTATGEYVEAGDTNGDTNGAASIDSAEAVDGDWGGTNLTININGYEATIDPGINAAAAIAAIAADAQLDDRVVGSDAGGGVLRITSRETGANQALVVTHDLATGWANGLLPNYANGTDADYRVSTDFVDLLDDNQVATAQPVATALVGFFDESNLRDLTSEARAVLSRRGSIFG